MEGVQLEDDSLLCQTGNGGGDTSCGSEIDFAIFLDGTHFDNCPINIAQKAIAKVLCHHAKVDVVVGNLTSIDMLTKRGVGCVWGTIADSLLVRQYTIAGLARRSTCEDANLVGTSCFVLSMSNFGYLCRYCLWGACWSETRQADVVSILDECCSLCSGDSCKCHKPLSITQFFKICAKLDILFGMTK